MKIKRSELIKNKGEVKSQALDISQINKNISDKLDEKLAEIITTKYININKEEK